MLCDQELSEFFAHVEELSQASQDSTATNHFQPTCKLQEENAKLKVKLHKVSKSTREVLGVFRNERNLKNAALCELEETKQQMAEVQRLYEELQNENVNQEFSWKEKHAVLDVRIQDLLKYYIELSKDYLEVLSETTVSYCFEVDLDRNKIVNRTKNFLRSNLTGKYEMPKIISRRKKVVKSTKKIDSKSPAKRTRNKLPTEEEQQQKEAIECVNRKRRKIESFDMQSISQVTSPASYFEDETLSDVGSSFSFNTFSIGNETSYTLIESKRHSNQHKCKCQEESVHQISIGVGTEELTEEPQLPSVPLLSEIDIDFDSSEIVCSTLDTSSQENVIEKDAREEIEVPVKVTSSIGTNTEIATSNKSTSTVHSTTTRGTSTPQVISKSFGMQYPEINYERIFAETIFELPDCLSPIDELENLIQEIAEETKSTATQETQTTLLNVCREIDYVSKASSCNSSEEQSFNLLGKSVFNIFLERLRKSNKSLNDEASARERLWSYMQHQFFNRFDELTFDDYFNPSFLHESDKCSMRVTKGVQEKENYEDRIKGCPEELQKPQIELNDENSLPPIEDDSEQCSEFVEVVENIKAQCLTPPPIVEPIPEILSPIKERTLIDDLFGDSNESDESLSPVKKSRSSIERSPSPVSITDEANMSDFEEPDNDNESCTSSDNEISDDELNFNDYQSPMSPSVEDRGFEGDYYIETPKSPPPFARDACEFFEPIEIPFDTSNPHLKKIASDNPLEYKEKVRRNLVQWQQRHVVSNQKSDKLLCKFRKAIQTYLDGEWSDENLEICLDQLAERNEALILEAIFETVEDNEFQKEINLEFTPPAPPLPRYQQKLILLIKRLTAECYPKLPHLLLEDLEVKLFRCNNNKSELDYLRNMAYYYTSLVDLFFEGNSTTVFYFIVKCIYFYANNAIPMIFVLVKAFPQALPKKSTLLKKYSTNIDWESMTGLELSKVRLDLEWVDSLDLTVIYLLTSIQMYRRKDPSGYTMGDHEFFNYLPKFYGFPLNFLAAPRLLDLLMKRLEDGETTNLSLSLILLAKRTNKEFAIRTLMKGKLVPLLHKLSKEISENSDEKAVDQICILIEVISSTLKALTDEKDKSFQEIFPFIINTLGRAQKSLKIQECCIRAILRLQRFVDNHKEIYDIIEKHYNDRNSFSESLRLSIVTFIHRKNEIYFKKK